nr:hypothetical protein [Tanacetum cinerariifolium]
MYVSGRVDIFDMVDLFTVVALNMMVLILGHTDIGPTQEPILAEVSTQEPIVAEVSTQEPIVEEVNTEAPIMEEVETQAFSVEDVVNKDYVSSGEDTKQGIDENDDVDEDLLVDKDNEIVEPDIDVYLFGISMDLPFDNTNLVPDDVLEREDVDFINADGFDSDLGNDEERNYKKRRLAELRTEIEGVINASVIIPAIKTIYPSAKHIYCLRYIHENMKQRWCGQAYKDLLWRAASATNVRDFKKFMLELKTMIPKAYEWLNKIPAEHWARSYFLGRAKSNLLLNNICEVFNGKIVRGRDKPVITLLEYIKEYCMKRIMNVQGVIDRCIGPLTPTATRIKESIKKEAHLIKVQCNGANKYHVSGLLGDQCVVDVVIGQDGLGGLGAGAVIGLSAATGEGGAVDPGGAGVTSQGSSHTRWTRRRVQTKILVHKKELPINLDYMSVVGGTDDGEKGTDVMKDTISQKNVCKEEVPLNNNIGKQIGDFVYMPSEAVEKRMDANVPDEIDGAKGEHVPNHVV